jgi:hypothetical protein
MCLRRHLKARLLGEFWTPGNDKIIPHVFNCILLLPHVSTGEHAATMLMSCQSEQQNAWNQCQACWGLLG